MEKWPLRIVCAFSLLASAARQFNHGIEAGPDIGPLVVFWFFGGLVSLLLAMIVLAQGVR